MGDGLWVIGPEGMAAKERRERKKRRMGFCDMKKSILNYTTEVSLQKTAGEIQELLARAKAQAILTEYSPAGELLAISFRVPTLFGVMTFRLPANVEKVYKVMCLDRRVPPRLRTKEQAQRVAWRILKDWLEAQLALIEVQMVTLMQVFLPYAQNAQGVPLYEELESGKFQGLALMPPVEGGRA